MRELRAAFVEIVAGLDPARLWFVDETGSQLTYTRRYARAPGGARANSATPCKSGPNVTVVAALTPTGLAAVMSVEGAMSGAVFGAYLEHVLAPALQAGDVVVVDNLSAHKVKGIAQYVEQRGARLLYLPPYSPDFNPIELAFSKLKTALRTAQARTRAALDAALKVASDAITALDAQNWFAHCGYHVH